MHDGRRDARYWPCLAVNGVGTSMSLVGLDDHRRRVYSPVGHSLLGASPMQTRSPGDIQRLSAPQDLIANAGIEKRWRHHIHAPAI
jgi:hypothetical protein